MHNVFEEHIVGCLWMGELGQLAPSGEGARKKGNLEPDVKGLLCWSKEFGFYLVDCREAVEFLS